MTMVDLDGLGRETAWKGRASSVVTGLDDIGGLSDIGDCNCTQEQTGPTSGMSFK
mgnify:FL=1